MPLLVSGPGLSERESTGSAGFAHRVAICPILTLVHSKWNKSVV